MSVTILAASYMGNSLIIVAHWNCPGIGVIKIVPIQISKPMAKEMGWIVPIRVIHQS